MAQVDTCFPKVRRMLLFLAPLILTHFWPASTLLRGHLALATLSAPETDPQIWSVGAALMRFTWANLSERRILVSNFSVTCNGFCELLHIGSVSACLSSSVRLRLTSAAPCPEIGNPIVLYSMICTQQVRVSTHDGLPRSIVTFVTVRSRLPCSIVQVMFLQRGYCTFVIILFRPFTRLFINLTMCIRALFPNLQPLLEFF